MEYIKNKDYDYIMNKYHDSSKPFNSFERFIRRDEIFSDETGMDGDKIKEEIIRRDVEIKHLPHPVRKAKAFEFVLENTKISCDSRDIFPAINMIDRPLNSTLVKEWRNEVFGEVIPEIEKKRSHFEKAGIVTMWPDYDHSVPVWERIFGLGFAGLLRESELMRLSKNLTDEEDAFFEGIKITYTAIVDFIGRLYELAAKTTGSEKMAKALKNIQNNPPATFYEALLVDYIYFMLSEHVEGLQVRSLCNFDRILYPYYTNDLKNGVTEEEIRTDLAYFLLQFTAIGNYWNQPVFLGGCKEDESTEINELSYLFMNVYDKMNIYNPKVQIKVADSTPKDFLLKALDMIRRGNSSIVFVSDATIRKALVRAGATEEQARLCNIKGCYEYSVQSSMGCEMNYLNLLKPLEYTLHKGCDGVSGEFALIKSPEVSSYATFDEFYEEYKKQLCTVIDATIETVNTFEDYLSYISPQSMLSATYPSCLEKAKDALGGGGVTNDSVLSLGFLGDFADSMSMIKKYVFDKKEFTLAEFVKMLDANFEGYEYVRRKLLADHDKYGNNKDLPDGFVVDLTEFLAKYVCGRPNAKKRGGKWTIGFHVARMSYIQGEKTATSPNGRLLGEELSKNASASMGQNREGATAAILSVTKIDATAFTSDSSLDLGLLPSAVKGDDGLEAMYGLLMTFVKRGGHAMHINVFDADTLRDAQKNPEKYQDLQIRVCGWNVLWNNINKVEQDGFIRQAESLV
ncbi:MAG: pyruvate formate lyase family protein [Clostridia bacterium]|nr:pyruvate formate lyase family protein [Clostridia bacterium]